MITTNVMIPTELLPPIQCTPLPTRLDVAHLLQVGPNADLVKVTPKKLVITPGEVLARSPIPMGVVLVVGGLT